MYSRRTSSSTRSWPSRPGQHVQSVVASLGSEHLPARLLHLLMARPVALGSSVLPEWGPATGRPATTSGARARLPPKSPLSLRLTHPGGRRHRRLRGLCQADAEDAAHFADKTGQRQWPRPRLLGVKWGRLRLHNPLGRRPGLSAPTEPCTAHAVLRVILKT